MDGANHGRQNDSGFGLGTPSSGGTNLGSRILAVDHQLENVSDSTSPPYRYLRIYTDSYEKLFVNHWFLELIPSNFTGPIRINRINANKSSKPPRNSNRNFGNRNRAIVPRNIVVTYERISHAGGKIYGALLTVVHTYKLLMCSDIVWWIFQKLQ